MTNPSRTSSQTLGLIVGPFILLVSFTRTSPANAGCVEMIPKDSAFDFARVILTQTETPGPRERQELRDGCSSFNLNYNSTLAAARKHKAIEGDKFGWVDFRVLMISHMTAVKARLGKTATENTYLEEMDRVKAIKDPLGRMRAAYSLSRMFQGKYMDLEEREMEEDPYGSPQATLARAARTGTGGICRDFASLLTYTLDQVSRDEKGQAQFSVQFLNVINHSVVKVKLPPQTNSRWDWGQEFSLDPTKSEEFSPIPVPDLLSSNSKLAEYRDRCEQIVTCLRNQDAVKPKSALSTVQSATAGR